MQVKKTGGVHDVFLKKNSVTVSLMFKGIFEEAMLPHEISQIFTETLCCLDLRHDGLSNANC